MTDVFEGVDFFVDEWLYDDPYPYFEYLRETLGPVWIDDRYNMAVVTGHDEEVAVLRDNETFSSCNAPAGPFAPLPVEVTATTPGRSSTSTATRCPCTSTWSPWTDRNTTTTAG